MPPQLQHYVLFGQFVVCKCVCDLFVPLHLTTNCLSSFLTCFAKGAKGAPSQNDRQSFKTLSLFTFTELRKTYASCPFIPSTSNLCNEWQLLTGTQCTQNIHVLVLHDVTQNIYLRKYLPLTLAMIFWCLHVCYLQSSRVSVVCFVCVDACVLYL